MDEKINNKIQNNISNNNDISEVFNFSSIPFQSTDEYNIPNISILQRDNLDRFKKEQNMN